MMYKEGDEIHETAEEAREGVNVRGMTLVLWSSLGLAILAFVVVVLFARH